MCQDVCRPGKNGNKEMPSFVGIGAWSLLNRSVVICPKYQVGGGANGFPNNKKREIFPFERKWFFSLSYLNCVRDGFLFLSIFAALVRDSCVRGALA